MSITALLFLLLFGAGLVLAFIRHPIFGLYAYLLAFYLNPPAAWWNAEVPDIRWSMIAAVVTLAATIPRSRNPVLPAWIKVWPVKLLIAYVLWMWIQSFWALDPIAHREMAILFTKYVVLSYLIYNICGDEQTIRGFALAHVAGCFYLGWLAYGINVSGRLENLGGAGISDANTLGMHLATGLAFAGFMLMALKDWRRWAVFLAIPFILNGIILTESRGAFVGLLAAGAVAWYLKPRAYRKWFYVAGALALVLVVRLGHDMFWERMGSTAVAVTSEQVDLDKSATSRIAIMESQWAMARNYPLGAGAKGTRALSPYYLDSRYQSAAGFRASHNTPMSVLVDQGFPGLGLYFLGVLWVLVTIRRLKVIGSGDHPVELAFYFAAVGSALAASFVSGMFSNFLKAEVQVWCVALLAVLWGLARAATTESATSFPRPRAEQHARFSES